MHLEGSAAHLRAEGARRPRRLVPHLLPRRRRARPLLRRDRAVVEHARLLDAVDRRARRRSGNERGGARRAQRAPAPHYRRIVDNGAIYSQPFSEGGAAAAGAAAFGTEAKPVDGGFLVSGKKIFASLSGAADYYGMLCTERAEGEEASRRNTLYLAVPANAPGVERRRRLGPARHARHGFAHAADEGRVRARERAADAARRLFPRRDLVAAHVPHALADLYGPRAGGVRLHHRVSAWRGARHAAGETPHVPDQADRGRRDARDAGADQGALVPGGERGARESRPRSRCCAPTRRNTP